MIQIEIHWIWLVIILVNLISLSVMITLNDSKKGSVVAYGLVILGYVFLSFLVPIGLLITLIWDTLREYVWKEIQFYYRFYLTNYYERLVIESTTTKGFLKGVNELSIIWSKAYPNTFIQKRVRRHVELLNKRFEYDYQDILKREEEYNKQSQEEINKEIYKN